MLYARGPNISEGVQIFRNIWTGGSVHFGGPNISWQCRPEPDSSVAAPLELELETQSLSIPRNYVQLVVSTPGKEAGFVTVFTQLMYTSTACLLSIFTAESLHHIVQMANVETMWELYSLVPRPSHHPVFDRLQYAKTEGESLVHFITWMTSVST